MTPSVSLDPVSTLKASEAIFNQIRQKIMNGELKPGDKLPSERTMTEMLERSRPTIREALRMLENAGLIKITPGGGAVVKEPSSSMVETPLGSMLAMGSITSSELLEFRTLNELAVVQWAAARRTEQNIADMEKCLDDAREQTQDTPRFFELDIKFHSLIAVAAQNRLSGMVDKVIHRLVTNLLVTAFTKKDAQQQTEMCKNILTSHNQILDAIRRSDPENARAIMRDHLSMFEQDVLLIPPGK